MRWELQSLAGLALLALGVIVLGKLFLQVPHWFFDLPLKVGPRAVLLALHRFWAPGGQVYPSYKTLAAAAGIGRTQLIQHLQELERLGLVRIVRRKGAKGQRSNLYELEPMPNMRPKGGPFAALFDQGSGNRIHPVDNSLGGSGNRIHPRTVSEPTPYGFRTRPRPETGHEEEQVEEEQLSRSIEVDIAHPEMRESVRDPFDDFWSAWPKKVNKKRAGEEFRAAVEAGTDPQMIIDAAKAFVKSEEWPDERQFQPSPDKWLNGERWDDELSSNSQNGWMNQRRGAAAVDRNVAAYETLYGEQYGFIGSLSA